MTSISPRETEAILSQAELNLRLAAHERFAYSNCGERLQLRNVNIRGLNLANRNLTEADFAGASLVRATLFGSNLTRARLCCTDLRECDLRGANLTEADLRGASFKGAKLSNAILERADIRAVLVNHAGKAVSGHYRQDTAASGNEVGADFSNCSLKNVSFSNARLENAIFDGAILQGVIFKGAKLYKASFRGAVMMGIDVGALKLPPEALEGCIMDVSAEAAAKAGELRERLKAHFEWVASDGKSGAAAVLDGEDLRSMQEMFAGACLAGLSARHANGIGIDFSGCQLQAAKFDGADLRGADFSRADLSGVSFNAAKLTQANFDRAILRKFELVSGGAISPDLTGADVTEIQFETATLDKEATGLGIKTPENA